MYQDTDTRRYYNATFVNTDKLFTPAEYKETRISPILDKPSDWYMSVTRFDVDSSLIPLNFPIMTVGSTEITASTITIYLTATQTSFTKNIELETEFFSTLPYGNKTAIIIYSELIGAINTALIEAYSDAGLVGFVPFFYYDPKTQLISIFVDGEFMPNQLGPDTDPIAELFINCYLQNYLRNFSLIIDPEDQSISNDELYQIATDENYDIYLPNGGNRDGLPKIVQDQKTDLWNIQQESPGTSFWNSLRSIILTSSSLPFRTEFIPSTPTNSINYSSRNIFPILIDHLVPQEQNPVNGRDIIEFLPSPQVYNIDLVGQFPLNSIDFKFYWSDFQGNIFPLFLGLNGGLSIKILFEKKNSLIRK